MGNSELNVKINIDEALMMAKQVLRMQEIIPDEDYELIKNIDYFLLDRKMSFENCIKETLYALKKSTIDNQKKDLVINTLQNHIINKGALQNG